MNARPIASRGDGGRADASPPKPLALRPGIVAPVSRDTSSPAEELLATVRRGVSDVHYALQTLNDYAAEPSSREYSNFLFLRSLYTIGSFERAARRGTLGLRQDAERREEALRQLREDLVELHTELVVEHDRAIARGRATMPASLEDDLREHAAMRDDAERALVAALAAMARIDV